MKTVYYMRISDWSSDLCSSDRLWPTACAVLAGAGERDLFDSLAADEHDKVMVGLLLVGENLEGGENGAVLAAQVAQFLVVIALVFLDLAFARGDCRLDPRQLGGFFLGRSEEHTSELQSLMRISYAVLCLKKKTYT